jgi:hypothetical protein
VSGVAGKIAIVDFTVLPGTTTSECGSGARAARALAAGATGIIFVAPTVGLFNLAASPLIASVEVSNADGTKIKAGLPAQATMSFALGTDNSVRWLMGEEVPGGALRDMWNPQCAGNPGKVSDVEYSCSAADQGGVHTNSGVDNHAYALMVDGGDYNGQSIAAIGITKAAHVYFRAKTQYQGPATDFADHADALENACSDLVGVNLASLTTGALSGEVVTAGDCAQVSKAILAVEMRNPPVQCAFKPMLAKNPPALCPANTRFKKVYRQGFELDDDDDGDDGEEGSRDGSFRGWRVSHQGTVDFTERDWELVTGLPDKRAGRAFFGVDPNIGSCDIGGDESAVLHLDSPVIKLKEDKSATMLAFDHYVATEAGWDGGNLKISVNNGPWQIVAAADFTYNAYNATLLPATTPFFNTDPIAGQPAFTGTDGGSVDGSWGRSIINLAKYAKPKDRIRLRFDIGTDGCGGIVGWFVDDVQLYQCRAPKREDRDDD